MDVVLEVVDTFIADYAYAYFYPKRPAPYDFPSPSNTTDTSAKAFSTWSYKPATQFLTLEPPEQAYMSAWERDNPLRQALTLYLITWYAITLTIPTIWTNMLDQDLWPPCVFHRRNALLHIHLRQAHL